MKKVVDIDGTIQRLREQAAQIAFQLRQLEEARNLLTSLNGSPKGTRAKTNARRTAGKKVTEEPARHGRDDFSRTRTPPQPAESATAATAAWRDAAWSLFNDRNPHSLTDAVVRVREAGHEVKPNTVVKWLLSRVEANELTKVKRGHYVLGGA